MGMFRKTATLYFGDIEVLAMSTSNGVFSFSGWMIDKWQMAAWRLISLCVIFVREKKSSREECSEGVSTDCQRASTKN
jgi:hypothetical protein